MMSIGKDILNTDLVHQSIELIGLAIRQVRILRKVKQSELAAYAGITQSYMCNIEKGNRPVSIDILKECCILLCVTPMQLFSLTFTMEQAVDNVIELHKQFKLK
jgi:transcriptional regulator with XRE-family HTH domain